MAVGVLFVTSNGKTARAPPKKVDTRAASLASGAKHYRLALL